MKFTFAMAAMKSKLLDKKKHLLYEHGCMHGKNERNETSRQNFMTTKQCPTAILHIPILKDL